MGLVILVVMFAAVFRLGMKWEREQRQRPFHTFDKEGREYKFVGSISAERSSVVELWPLGVWEEKQRERWS